MRGTDLVDCYFAGLFGFGRVMPSSQSSLEAMSVRAFCFLPNMVVVCTLCPKRLPMCWARFRKSSALVKLGSSRIVSSKALKSKFDGAHIDESKRDNHKDRARDQNRKDGAV
jgi:hypothetical protein